MKPDILVFMSDQHSYQCSGFGGDAIIRTPNMDRIAAGGVSFQNAYTSCPLCVPARISLLTGRLPSTDGAFSNGCAIPDDQATMLHSLAAQGYETVICGRMHFMGADLMHGFTRRIMGELLTSRWGEKSTIENDLGRFRTTFTERGCLKLTGGGYSPVMEYDKAVIEAAMEYLSQKHEKPQFVVVGTYGPHFSYVAPPELYSYYFERVLPPHTQLTSPNYRHPALIYKEQNVDERVVRSARAAYYGMVEQIDTWIGSVYDEFNKMLLKRNKQGLFVYLSDHGDQLGERRLFGKQTFFDPSAKIPLILSGCGIPDGKVIPEAVSICDVAPTLLEYVGAEPLPDTDGKSVLPLLQEPETQKEDARPVYCEYILSGPQGEIPGRMAVMGGWKLISYYGYEDQDLLFDLKKDPWELQNLAEECTEKHKEMLTILQQGWDEKKVLLRYRFRQRSQDLVGRWCDVVNPPQERWIPNIPLRSSRDVLMNATGGAYED